MHVGLGIDVGSTNTKVVLVEVGERVRELAVRAAPTPAEADRLVATVLDLVRAVTSAGDRRPEAVGVASMAETGVPLGADGRALTPLLRWDGRRAGEQAAELARVHGADALFAATGVRPSAKAPLATWAWLAHAEPAVRRRMRRWLGAADLVVHAVTGAAVTDHTLAGRTMAYRLPRPGEPLAEGFDVDLLAAAGMTPDLLPRVLRPQEIAGLVRAAGVAGLRGGTPVVLAGHDHAVGTWAAGVRHPGARADSIGTAEAVLTVLGAPVEPGRVRAAGMSLVRTVAADREAVLAGSGSAGSMLGWLAERLARPLGEVLVEAGRAAGPRAPDAPLVLPYLAGRQSPAPDPSARVQVVGSVDGPDRDVSLALGVLDGLCLQARWMLAEQGRVAGAIAGGPVTVLGGPALEVAAWRGLKASTSPWPLRWVGAREPVATGAGVLALVRAGVLGAVPEALLGGPVLDAADGQAGGGPAQDARLARFVCAATGARGAGAPGAVPLDD